MISIWGRAFLTAAVVLAATLPVVAQQQPAPPKAQPKSTCSRLDAQLQAFERGDNDNARVEQLRKLEDASGKQQTEIDRQEDASRRSGCESNAFFQEFNSQTPQCGPINKKIQQMRSNLTRILADIERLRIDPAPQREGQRRAILVAMEQNNCGKQDQPQQAATQPTATLPPEASQPLPPPAPTVTQRATAPAVVTQPLPQPAPSQPPITQRAAAQPVVPQPPAPQPAALPPPVQQRATLQPVAAQPAPPSQPATAQRAAAQPPATQPTRGGLFETLFGAKSVFNPGSNASPPAADAPSAPEATEPSGTYRTVCVRLCDGFYYPISAVTNSSRFADDEKACRQSCPASDVMLFSHRNQGEDMNQAVSVSNQQPYTALPNAYRYRTALDQSCSCKRQGETWSQALKNVEDTTVEQGDIVVNDQRARQLSQPRIDAQGKPIRQAPVANAKPAPAARPAPAAAASAAPAADAAPEADAPSKPDPNRTVRTVGPTFLPTR